MKAFVVLSVLIAVVCGNVILDPNYVEKPRLDGKIVGGRDADIADFPYQVSMQKYGYHNCGGSIIAKNWVLTAAHCLEGGITADLITFRVGSSIHNKGGRIVKAVQIFNHPRYNKRTFQNDVALVLTEEDLTGDNAEIIKLPYVNQEVKIGKTGIISGWGDLTDGGFESPSNLQFVAVKVVDQDFCHNALKIFGGIDETMFCAANKDKDSCQGDSGGPIVIDNTLVGVVSWGIGCANPRYPGVYARLAHPVNRDWIMKMALV